MGIFLIPVFEQPLELAPPSTWGERLGACVSSLDEIAAENGLPSISSFGDSRGVPHDFEGDPEELDYFQGPCQDWYDAGSGAAALKSISSLLATKPELGRRVDKAEDVIRELNDLAMQIEQAAASGVRFRLSLG